MLPIATAELLSNNLEAKIKEAMDQSKKLRKDAEREARTKVVVAVRTIDKSRRGESSNDRKNELKRNRSAASSSV